MLDEVQRRPNLFPALRVLADRARTPARFLILGSASPALAAAEFREPRRTRRALRALRLRPLRSRSGGAPAPVVSRRVPPLVRRDAAGRPAIAGGMISSKPSSRGTSPHLGISIPGTTMERFWGMLAHYHGQVWNGSELARAFGVSHHDGPALSRGSRIGLHAAPPEAVERQPRQTPGEGPEDLPVRDSGLLHRLLDIRNRSRELERHPKIGASWEGFVIECVTTGAPRPLRFLLLLGDPRRGGAGPAGTAAAAACAASRSSGLRPRG